MDQSASEHSSPQLPFHDNIIDFYTSPIHIDFDLSFISQEGISFFVGLDQQITFKLTSYTISTSSESQYHSVLCQNYYSLSPPHSFISNKHNHMTLKIYHPTFCVYLICTSKHIVGIFPVCLQALFYSYHSIFSLYEYLWFLHSFQWILFHPTHSHDWTCIWIPDHHHSIRSMILSPPSMMIWILQIRYLMVPLPLSL